MSAPTSIPTVRRGPHRVTTKLERDTRPSSAFHGVLWHFQGALTSHADPNRSPCWGFTKNSGGLRAEATQLEQNHPLSEHNRHCIIQDRRAELKSWFGSWCVCLMVCYAISLPVPSLCFFLSWFVAEWNTSTNQIPRIKSGNSVHA